MIYYDRTDISEGIGVNKTSKWTECNICHCWYFNQMSLMDAMS